MRIGLPLLVLVVACSSPSSGPSVQAPDAAPIDATTSDSDAATNPAPTLPTPTGTCPALASGDVVFAPAGIPPRKVKLALDAAKLGQGPLIFYWHATGSSPLEASYSLGATQKAIVASGGVVATPYADPAAGQFEWFVVNGSSKTDDFVLADEVVACFAQQKLIDGSRIHSMGMSAGALQTTAFGFARATYIASVATYSGGVPPGFTPTNAAPANKFAALIFDGGATDTAFMVDFKAASETYKALLDAAGHFTAICDHGKGHTIPLDAAPSVATFFAANPYGAWPSPYTAAGLPTTFPSYCAR